MKRHRSGSIVNNGSVAAHAAGYSSSMVYSAAKAAAFHFTRCVAMELGEYGVRVNSVSPGAIATGIFAKALGMTDASETDALADRMTSNFATMKAIPRSGYPTTLPNCWLASDRSTFINGEDVIVDGGLVRGRLFTPKQTGLRQVKSMLGLDDSPFRSPTSHRVHSSKISRVEIGTRIDPASCLQRKPKRSSLPWHVEGAQDGHRRRLIAIWQDF